MSEPLLSAKLTPPLGAPDVVARPRLFPLLNEGLQRKLTLVSAPAGFGKTTLIGEWVSRRTCGVGWVSLSEKDNEPIRFWSYVSAALESLAPDAAKWLPPYRLPRSAEALGAFVNALTGVQDDIVLVLDDYHTITSLDIHDSMAFLIDHLPSRVHVVISTRSDPDLPLARLRAKGEMTEVRAADLSFTQEETRAFLIEAKRLGLSAEDVSALRARTEGWIVGLQLAALSLRGHEENVQSLVAAFTGNQRHVFDYLVEDVLYRQPESVQTFLLQTSILDRLNSSLCEAVAGVTDGQAMLVNLERANLFTQPLDNERRWYRYHHLFAEALRARLQLAHADWIPSLHIRAYEWFIGHNQAADGVGHALASGQSELAADLIERIGMSMVQNRFENGTVIGWVTALPADKVRARPRLSLLHCWALAYSGQLDAAEAKLQEVKLWFDASCKEGMSHPGDSSESSVHSLMAEIVAASATIAGFRWDAQSALSLANQAIELAAGSDPTMRSIAAGDLGIAHLLRGNLSNASKALAEAARICKGEHFSAHVLATLSMLAGVTVIEGRLRLAGETYREVLRLAEENRVQSLAWAAAPHVGIGWLMYEWNDLDSAMHHAVVGVESADRYGQKRLLLHGWGVMARVRSALGDIDGAIEILEQAERVARRSDLRHDMVRLTTCRVRLWLMHDRTEEALRWAREAGLHAEDDDISYQREAEYIALARVLLAQGNSGEAARLLGRLLSIAESADRMGSVVKISALRALALHTHRDTDDAMETIERALTIALPERYIRTFIDLGTPMACLLETALTQRGFSNSHARLSKYARDLLNPSRPPISPQADTDGSSRSVVQNIPLSGREIEVLRSLALGHSTPQIAEELTVAVSTIRSHVEHIYSKLDAHNRVEAITLARARGFL